MIIYSCKATPKTPKAPKMPKASQLWQWIKIYKSHERWRDRQQPTAMICCHVSTLSFCSTPWMVVSFRLSICPSSFPFIVPFVCPSMHPSVHLFDGPKNSSRKVWKLALRHICHTPILQAPTNIRVTGLSERESLSVAQVCIQLSSHPKGLEMGKEMKGGKKREKNCGRYILLQCQIITRP